MLYVNTNAIGDALGVTPATVSRWARDGLFPGARIVRNKWAVPLDQAQAFIGERLGQDEAEDEEDAWEGDEEEGADEDGWESDDFDGDPPDEDDYE